ncbi:hypothetical protein LCGC14_3013010 [marine sediment metagenome]|uniref:Uncharacterized protein n=1 Tax=marine sediment metagenome TaxID=412755 RepID=A0A0F8XKG2_9ZZZZ
MDDVSEDQIPDALVHTAPSFAGMWRFLKGRLGRPTPPRLDATKLPVQFQPYFRVVVWDGAPDDHLTAECALPPVCALPGEYGEHSEVRPDGFEWEGARFHSLFDALENQAFRRWYETGGQEILERGELTVRAPLYREDERPPLPTFNFFLHENMEKMTAQEIMAYRRTGEVPTRLRRRGRNKTKPEALEEVGG